MNRKPVIAQILISNGEWNIFIFIIIYINVEFQVFHLTLTLNTDGGGGEGDVICSIITNTRHYFCPRL